MTMPASWQDDVLSFWFGELTPEDWFTSKPATDAAITERFGETWSAMRKAVPAEAFMNADAALAATLVCDQFPRNMFRGTAEAFATDPLALALARHALAKGFHQTVGAQRQTFLFMPFMHSESLDDQELCVSMFGLSETAKYAIEHRDIIARFGRFPHRNRVLGRENTPEEADFLSEHAGFGQ